MRGAQRIALTAVFLLASSSALWAQSRIAWVSSWSEASALAQRHQRFVLIHFLSNNCPPCVKLERSVFNQPEVIRAMTSNYIPLAVNVDENAELARFYGVDRWPTDVIVTPQGAVIYRGPSPMDPNRYIATLDQVASHARVGVPFTGSPSTEIAMTSPGDMPNRETLNRASAFPADAAAGASGVYTPPSLPGSNPYASQTPTGNSTRSGGGLPEQGGVAARSPLGNPPPAASYMTNQYATDTATQAPSTTRPAEQRASFTSPYGGDFQPPSASPAAAASSLPNHPPQSTGNPYVAGPQMPNAAELPQGGTTTPRAAQGPDSPTFQARATYETPSPTQSQVTVDAPAGTPSVAIDGYCSVTLIEEEKWVKGDPKWGAVHRGRTYLFAGPEQQRQFLANYDKYSPALSGYDCVKYAEQGALIDGRRAHGVFYRGQIFMFADETSLQTFWSSPERFVPYVRAEQQRQATRPSGAPR